MFQIRDFLLILIYFLTIFIINGQRQCTDDEWKCTNGECIDSDNLCDGKLHCYDNSDETYETCYDLDCPSYATTCSYGACILGSAKCDGIKDCHDNSDETSCQNVDIQGNCKSMYDFQCDSGQCISSDNTCDGIKNCVDGSDETYKLCSGFDCPAFAFHCVYGGCIDKKFACDGTQHCADGSDESKQLCDDVKKTGFISNTGIIDAGCKIEKIGSLLFLSAANNQTLPYGYLVPNGAKILYQCPTGYILDGPNTNLCFSSKWFNKLPTCTKLCDNSVLKGVTFEAKCEHLTSTISCNDKLRPGTLAKLSCNLYYHDPDTIVDKIIWCNQTTSEWQSKPYRCTPECGRPSSTGIAFIAGGVTGVNITRVPWHVGIYERGKNGIFGHICGGTILTEQVIISVAHCFWDDSTNTRKIKEYQVGVGKLYRDYYTDEPQAPEFFNATSIHIPAGFGGSFTGYNNDIAIIILDRYIVFSPYAKPICIEFDNRNRHVPENVRGRVAGWGKTEDEKGPSEDLRFIDLPIVSADTCRKSVQPQYQKSITDDKFCVNHVDGETVCQGDSGGGFALPKQVGHIETYFLRGLVSIGLNDKAKCGGHYYTTMTNIQSYEDFIKPFYLNYRPL